MNRFERLLRYLNIDSDPHLIEDLYAQSEMTRSYTTLLLLANFIALFGLITDSIAVIIGAMLISPLMGPIISFGFAYITSEKRLMKQSLQTLGKSLVYVIASAALLSYLSPLNDLTGQILARTRPNLYDLFIAVFSGLVVAVSFLSKKINSVSTLTGVAIATSIIPPLSVVGFGIGTGNWQISVGSFLLFFTNFTAIVATTALSGIIFGFTYFNNLKDFAYIKRKLITIILIIAAVSLPLSYTLKQSIQMLKIRRVINQAVSEIQNATVFSLTYDMDDKRNLNISLALASGKPIAKQEVMLLKSAIENRLGIKSTLTVTQVALKDDIVNNKPAIVQKTAPLAPVETVSSTAVSFRAKTDEMVAGLSDLLSPYPVQSYEISMTSSKKTLLTLYVKKDSPCTQQETDMLANYIRSEYKFNSDVAVVAEPIFTPLIYRPQTTEPEGGFPDFSIIKSVSAKTGKALLTVTCYPESSLKYRDRMRVSADRFGMLKKHLEEKYGIPPESINMVTSRNAVKEPKLEIALK